MKLERRSVLPGFGLTMGFTLLYLSLIVLIPLSALLLKSATISWSDFWRAVSDPQVVASYKLSLGASLAAATINVVFGFVVAWVLVRYSFPGRQIPRRLGRSAVCDADGRLGDRAGVALQHATVGSAAGWRRWGSRSPITAWG